MRLGFTQCQSARLTAAGCRLLLRHADSTEVVLAEDNRTVLVEVFHGDHSLAVVSFELSAEEDPKEFDHRGAAAEFVDAFRTGLAS